ncbi:brachyurin-like [Cloeon dipterum]|uniref:brachyurin-like n=1 Tax=Cloeon dipterum TaxID=197152 RepID=UPI00321F7BE9
MLYFRACILLLIFARAQCTDTDTGENATSKDVFKGKTFVHRTKPIPSEKKDSVLERMKKRRQEAALNKDGTVQIGTRIIHGRLANKGEFPYQVAVIADVDEICGGSLISLRHVLTAAHCVYGKHKFDLILGSLDQETADAGSTTITSTKAEYHNLYNNETLANDIAIIYLPKAVRETDYIKRITLPTRQQSSRVGQPGATATIAGWGRTSDASMDVSQKLKTANLNILPKSECDNAYGVENILSSNVCAFGDNGDSTCQGDSGGPLVEKVGNERVQIGLVSFGAGEGCEKSYPEVYTRVSSYISWINQRTETSSSASKTPPKNKRKQKHVNKKQNKKAKQKLIKPKKLIIGNNAFF